MSNPDATTPANSVDGATPEAPASRPEPDVPFDHEEYLRAGLARIAAEIATYEANLPGWGEHEGKFVLIRGRDVVGFFDDRFSALDLGYDRFGDGPFLVKEVRAIEPIRYAGNVIL